MTSPPPKPEAHRMSTFDSDMHREPYYDSKTPPYEYPQHADETVHHDDDDRSSIARPGTANADDRLSRVPTYYDPYTTHAPRMESQESDATLVKDVAEPMGKRNSEYTGNPPTFRDPEDFSPDAPSKEKSSPIARLMGTGGKYPLAQRIEDKKRGIGRQKYPFVAWTLTAAMAAVLIYELVVNNNAQGSPISLKPVVNPMLGPSSSALINLGARFPACMKDVPDIPVSTQLPCLNDTANPITEACSLEVICGFGGFHNKTPDQSFRFITPIFLHAGIVHLLLNMLAQMTVSAQIEREMGSGGFLLTYFAAGIFGNVLGANFALVGLPSVGASGAIFGTVAVTWVDLFAHWRYHYRPTRKLVLMVVELVFTVAMGYIPYVDNFAHLGGFLMGLLVGTVFLPVISVTKRHKSIMWGCRLAAIPLAIVLFVVLTRNFYTTDPTKACPGCRYLSCLPLKLNNYCKGTGLTTTTTTN